MRNGGCAMIRAAYPEIKEGRNLPVYVRGIGIDYTEEETVCRREGEALLLFSSEGAGEVTIDGIAYALPEGSAVYLNARTACCFRPCGDWKISRVTFGTGIPECGDMMFLGRDWCIFDLSRYEEPCRELLAGLYRAAALDAVYGEIRASGLLYQLIVLLNGILSGLPRKTQQQASVMETLVDFIDKNYARELTLEQLCQAAGGLSEQYLCRLFKQSTGMRPMEYLLRRRIDAARILLERSALTISEVALASGFRNTSYFYRSFRKFTGMSPLVYREASAESVREM